MPLIAKKVYEVVPGLECLNPTWDGTPKKTSHPVVYIFDMVDTPFLKIGSTSNVYSRFKYLQGASPFEIQCAFYACPPDGICHVQVELTAHLILRESRVRGEWFKCSIGDAIDAIRNAIKVEA